MKVKNSDGTNEGQTMQITVYEYFAKHCGIELQYSAYLPCLDVGKPKKPNYLPLEVRKLVMVNALLFIILFSLEKSCQNFILFLIFVVNVVSAMFTCLTTTLHKSIIISAEDFFG